MLSLFCTKSPIARFLVAACFLSLLLVVLSWSVPLSLAKSGASKARALTDAARLEAVSSQKPLRIITKRIEPFVAYENGWFSGFSIDLWEKIATQNGWKYELELVPTLAGLLDEMKNARADGAVAAVTITSEREKYIDFSHPFYRSGLAILVRDENTSTTSEIFRVLRAMFLSSTFIWAALFLLVTLFVVSNIIWLLERRNNPDFSRGYLAGLWDSFWWAMVTITTVGYGDKAPKAVLGKLFAMLWMIVGYFMFAYFTAAVTSSVTVRELRGSLNGPDDLPGHKVAVINKSTSADYLSRLGAGVNITPVDQIEQAFLLLESGKVEAVVHDAPVLLYYAARKGQGRVKVVGGVFHKEDYGIVLPDKSPLREPVNRALLHLVESGAYEKLYKKWFGPQNTNE